MGPNDEQVLAKRFPKNAGPRSTKIQDPEGSHLKSSADAHYQAVVKEREAQLRSAEEDGTDTLAETLDGNSKKRKKEHALRALAKRAPARKGKSLGSVVVS